MHYISYIENKNDNDWVAPIENKVVTDSLNSRHELN